MTRGWLTVRRLQFVKGAVISCAFECARHDGPVEVETHVNLREGINALADWQAANG